MQSKVGHNSMTRDGVKVSLPNLLDLELGQGNNKSNVYKLHAQQ